MGWERLRYIQLPTGSASSPLQSTGGGSGFAPASGVAVQLEPSSGSWMGLVT